MLSWLTTWKLRIWSSWAAACRRVESSHCYSYHWTHTPTLLGLYSDLPLSCSVPARDPERSTAVRRRIIFREYSLLNSPVATCASWRAKVKTLVNYHDIHIKSKILRIQAGISDCAYSGCCWDDPLWFGSSENSLWRTALATQCTQNAKESSQRRILALLWTQLLPLCALTSCQRYVRPPLTQRGWADLYFLTARRKCGECINRHDKWVK